MWLEAHGGDCLILSIWIDGSAGEAHQAFTGERSCRLSSARAYILCLLFNIMKAASFGEHVISFVGFSLRLAEKSQLHP